MTKAQEKRIKQLKESLTRKLSVKLRDFKDTYLGDYVDFKISTIKKEIISCKELINDPKKLQEYNEITQKLSRGKWYMPITAERFEIKLKNLEYSLKHSNINSLQWMNEANKGYETKFERLVEKIAVSEMDIYRLKIDYVGGGTTTDFGFLIYDDKKEVHARVIYACGEIKAPHYRFITTMRNLK